MATTAKADPAPMTSDQLAAALAAPKDINEAMAMAYLNCGYVQKQDSKNLGYTYAGVADLINHVRPVMAELGISMHVHQMRNVQRETYPTARGGTMHKTTIEAVVRFLHTSGTFIDVEAIGEAADSGDKSSPKAMTGAFKYALMQTFCIETGDDPDDYPSSEQERAPKEADGFKAPPRSQPANQQSARQEGIARGQAAMAKPAVAKAASGEHVDTTSGEIMEPLTDANFLLLCKSIIEGAAETSGKTATWDDLGAALKTQGAKKPLLEWYSRFRFENPPGTHPLDTIVHALHKHLTADPVGDVPE